MEHNEGRSDKDPELVNEGGVGEDDEDCMGDKEDVFIDRVREALV